MKRRLDELLLLRGHASSRKEAVALIMRGVVLVNQQKIDKPGTLVTEEDEVRLTLERTRYVSRGGLKLEAALQDFSIEVKGMTCADLGSSTGGFTDCLLQRGAHRVYAFDVGKGQLHWKLQKDERVVVRDDFNVRHLQPSDIPEKVDLIVADLAFISLVKILPALECFEEALMLLLVKPQFEALPSEVEEGGLIANEAKRTEILERVAEAARRRSFSVHGSTLSPVPGQKGNREYFLFLSRAGAGS